MTPFAFNLKYTPTEIQPSDAEALSARLAPKIQTAVEQAMLTGYGGGGVQVERTDTGFKVTVTPGAKPPPPVMDFDGEAQEFEPAHDIEELAPRNDQSLLASMAEAAISQVMPGFLKEILDTLRGRRGGR